MGLSGVSFGELLIILAIILLLFGTKRLASIGSDLGAAIRGFRSAIKDEPDEAAPKDNATDAGQPARR